MSARTPEARARKAEAQRERRTRRPGYGHRTSAAREADRQAFLAVLDVPAGRSWRLEAACRDADPAPFGEPDHGESPDARRERVAQAKAICRECPVRVQCLAGALAAGDTHTVRGGMTPAERRTAAQRAAAA